MAPTPDSTAWDDEATRRAWTKLITCAIAGQTLWPAAWVGLLAWYAIMSITWTLWLFFIPMAYTFYRSFLQLAYFTGAFRARRLLQHYPWQVWETPESGIGNIPGVRAGYAWLKFPDPEASDQLVTMVMHSHVRSVWWGGRLGKRAKPERKTQVEELWFAGDPRFAAVIAAPGPRRLYVIHQRPSYNKSLPAEAHGASPQALERARRTGIHVPDPDPAP
ncbi:hypothetical protein [Streptomyces sp. NBC_01236]|uniref:hypothetical protein n=1 Tax=Streptomyces sp. NBC_01236 TaxID=2903789 RepID=UPI002E1110E7|nr:hypothetical protein OG324_28750 [Streptomyces sp. NBC_01236]